MTTNWQIVDDILSSAVISPESEPLTADRVARFGVDREEIAGAALLVGHGPEVLYRKSYGSRSIYPDVTALHEEMVFDIASLTKPIATATIAMRLVQTGQLSLSKPIAQILQTYSRKGREAISVKHLLSHSSGYPAYLPLYKKILEYDRGQRAGILCSRMAVEQVYREVEKLDLEYPTGSKSLYSDIGFLLLGSVLETVSGGMKLERLFQKHVIEPLGLANTGYIDLSKVKRRGVAPISEVIVPTALCPWRDRVLVGEVHDDNAWVMGGIAPHAGLFSTISDVHQYIVAMLDCYHGRDDYVDMKVVKQFWSRDSAVPGSTWALGWDTPSAVDSTAGTHLSRNAVGHLGYTGCSMWVDPKSELSIVLLTNRVHPSVKNETLKTLRPRLHDAIVEAVAQ